MPLKIDRQKFYAGFRAAFGRPDQAQVDGLNFILDSIEADANLADPRWAAYMLATIKRETAGTFRSVHEYGTRQYFISRYGSQTRVGKELGNDTPEEGALYAGRGLVQITGESNYEMVEAALRREYPDAVARFEARTGKKFDLTVGDQPKDSMDPDNALDPEIAYCVMSYAMRNGAFTGVGLKKYISEGRCDYVNARRVINGLDRAEQIAGYARKFEAILKGAAQPSGK